MSKLSQKIAQAPNQPGCYLFKNKAAKVIYIGKAKDIRKRVKSYFKKDIIDHKTKEMVSRISGVEFIVTDNEVEALLLEAQLIRRHQPKYNIDLKGGRRYAYIKVTNEELPRLQVTRQVKRGDKVFGPFTSGAARFQLVSLANRLFKLHVGGPKPKLIDGFWHYRTMSVPFVNKISKEEYFDNLEKVKLLLKGETKDLLAQLKEEMRKFSAEKKYELAKLRRDAVIALESLAEKQKVELKKSYDQDVINFVELPNKFVVQLFNINKGVISGRKEFALKSLVGKNQGSKLADFLSQYYYANDVPQEVVVSTKPSDKKLLEEYLSQLAKRQVRITIPQKGDKQKLLALVKKNLQVSLQVGNSSLLELQEKLHLPKFPNVIECFDVSNLGDTGVVGSMVYSKDGQPDKNNYRRFKIKTFKGQSDFAAMREIVYRRYFRLKVENRDLPDLIMVDGGKPQLSAALKALAELGLSISVIALAKKEEEIYLAFTKYPVSLPKKSAALKMLQKIRNEAHRFAINYQKLLRKKRDFK